MWKRIKASSAVNGFIRAQRKPSARPGKLTFRMTPGDDQTRFGKINLSAAPVAVTGDVVTGKDGALVSAKFDSFKISPVEISVKIVRGEGNTTSPVQGGGDRLRPFIKNFMSGSQTDTQDADYDLRASSAVGFGEKKGRGSISISAGVGKG